MAIHTHTTYSCDRCKKDLGIELPDHNQSINITAAFNWREGPGPSFKWTDLCGDCRAAVMAFFQPQPRSTAGSEGRDARVFFAEVMAWTNKDMANHVLFRAMTILKGGSRSLDLP